MKKFKGLSHLLEHMFFRGTKNYPSMTLLIQKLQQYGAIINGTTTYETTYYVMTVHPTKLLHIMPILSEMIRFSNLDNYQLEEEKNILQNEVNYHSDMNYYLNELGRIKYFYK